MTEDPTGLGRAVQVRRAELGLKRKQLAESALLSYPYVAEIENGTKAPSTKALGQLARALELTSAELLERAQGHAANPEDGLSPGLSRDPASWQAWTTAASPRRGAMQGLLEQQISGLVAAMVDAEMRAWAERELPGLIRNEVLRLLERRGGEEP